MPIKKNKKKQMRKHLTGITKANQHFTLVCCYSIKYDQPISPDVFSWQADKAEPLPCLPKALNHFNPSEKVVHLP